MPCLWLLRLIILLRVAFVYSTVTVSKVASGSVITSFPDAVSLFGPSIFRLDGYLFLSQPEDACLPMRQIFFNNSELPFPPFIVLIKSGNCNDIVKVRNAQSAGFLGAIVYNIVDDTIYSMSSNESDPDLYIRSVFVGKKSGYELMKYVRDKDIEDEYMINMASFYSLPLKYILLVLLIIVSASLCLLVLSFLFHLFRLWRRMTHGRLPRRYLRRLATKRFNKGMDHYETCSICLEDYADGDKLRLLPCNHAYHMKCIDPWLLRNHRRCPVCNRVVEIPGAPPIVVENSDNNNVPQSEAEVLLRSIRALSASIMHSRHHRSADRDRLLQNESHSYLSNNVNDDARPLTNSCNDVNTNSQYNLLSSFSPISVQCSSSHTIPFNDDNLLNVGDVKVVLPENGIQPLLVKNKPEVLLPATVSLNNGSNNNSKDNNNNNNTDNSDSALIDLNSELIGGDEFVLCRGQILNCDDEMLLTNCNVMDLS